jgi:predicted PurR-regulated permease PerM
MHWDQSTEKPVIVAALNITFRTIEKRIKRYRYLVISVVLVTSVSILLAILYRQWLFVAGMILLVPLVGTFSILDSRSVRCWRTKILDMSRNTDLNLELFLKTADELRRFSPAALQNMLSIVRSAHKLKSAELAQFDEEQRKLEHKIVVATLFMTLALSCLMGSIFFRSLPMLLCGIGFTLPAVLLRRSIDR